MQFGCWNCMNQWFLCYFAVYYYYRRSNSRMWEKIQVESRQHCMQSSVEFNVRIQIG